MTPKDAEGGAGEDTPNAASNSDEAAITQPVDADRSEQASPRQPHDVDRPVQLPIPGLEGVSTEDIDDAQWSADAEAAIAELTASGRHFTADDLRKRVGVPEQRNRIGTAFMIAAVRGDIVVEGFRHSNARSRNRGIQRVWRGAA